VIFIPGNANYLLASDKNLTYKITERLKNKGIENEYVNFYYLDDHELERRGKEMMSRIGENGKINHDFNPVAYFETIKYWLSWYGKNLWNVIWPAVLLIVIIPFFLKKYTLGMYVAGFTASSLEILVLLTFQVVFGNFYQSLAILIAAFMAGLAVGVFLPGWFKIPVKSFAFPINQVLIGISALMLSSIVFLTEKEILSGVLLQVCLYCIMVFSGIVTAVHFTLAAGLQKANVSQTASKTYGADLLGSAGGAVLVAVVIIPLFGMMETGWLLAGLNMVVAGLLFFRLKNTSV